MTRRVVNRGRPIAARFFFGENGTLARELSRYLGQTTNNVAEYAALLMGLEALIEFKRQRILVQSNSQLLRQLSGEYRVTDENLKMLNRRATGLLRQFGSYRIVHVRREFNQVADRLANRGIDAAARSQIVG